MQSDFVHSAYLCFTAHIRGSRLSYRWKQVGKTGKWLAQYNKTVLQGGRKQVPDAGYSQVGKGPSVDRTASFF